MHLNLHNRWDYSVDLELITASLNWIHVIFNLSQPDTNQQQNSQFNSYYPYQFNNPAVPQSWAGNYQGHPRVGGATAQTEVNGNFLTLQIRIINGNFKAVTNPNSNYWQFNPLHVNQYSSNLTLYHPRLTSNEAPYGVLVSWLILFVGFETCIAAAWKRLMAEIIDTVVFTLLLKAYLPDADLR